jgi:hypothetical protein
MTKVFFIQEQKRREEEAKYKGNHNMLAAKSTLVAAF